MSKKNLSSPSSFPSPEELGYMPYKGSVPFEELQFPDEPANPDFEWAVNDPELQKKYSGKVVAVCNRKVWGTGKSFHEAVAEATKQPDCPETGLVLVVIV